MNTRLWRIIDEANISVKGITSIIINQSDITTFYLFTRRYKYVNIFFRFRHFPFLLHDDNLILCALILRHFVLSVHTHVKRVRLAMRFGVK